MDGSAKQLKDLETGDIIKGEDLEGNIIGNKILQVEIELTDRYVFINNMYKINPHGDHILMIRTKEGISEVSINDLFIGDVLCGINEDIKIESLETIMKTISKVSIILDGNESYFAGDKPILSRGTSHKFLKGGSL